MEIKMAKFLSGPTGKHGTQKIRKHRLKLGITRDMNAAAGTFVNTKNPLGSPGGFYGAAPKAIGPRFGKTKSPRKATFGKKSVGRIMKKRR